MYKRQLTIVGIVLIGATILFAITTFRQQAQDKSQILQDKSDKGQKHLQESKIKDAFPNVEYVNQFVDEARKAKSKKYNNSKVIESEILEDTTTVSFVKWLPTTSPLPVKESEVVIRGKVTAAQAHLSEDKRSVYSEFNIEIEKVFKNSSLIKYENGNHIKAEREGGIVLFPSGKAVWYSISGQRMPQIESKYIFFLTHEFPGFGYKKQDLFLLTGYEIKNGQIFPLDSPNGGTHPVATFYKEKEESVFLSDLLKAIGKSATILPE